MKIDLHFTKVVFIGYYSSGFFLIIIIKHKYFCLQLLSCIIRYFVYFVDYMLLISQQENSLEKFKLSQMHRSKLCADLLYSLGCFFDILLRK